MKSKFTILSFLATTIFFQVRSQEMVFLRGGKILFENKTIQKPVQILSIISKKESPELLAIFDKYKTNRSAGIVFESIGGFGIGYSLGGLLSGGKVNGGILASGVGVSAIGFIFDHFANSNLKKMVDLYNGKSSNKVSFQPILKSEFGNIQLGLIAKF
jgi:hypothetical protein